MSDFTLCLLGKFFMLFCHLLIFFKSTFLKNSFRNTIRVSNNLVPDQARHLSVPIWVQTVCKGYQLTTQLSGFFDMSEFEKGKAFTNIKFLIYLFTQEAQLYLLLPSADNSKSANQQKTKKHAKLLSRQTIKNMRSKYIIHSKLQVKWLQQLWDHKNIFDIGFVYYSRHYLTT